MLLPLGYTWQGQDVEVPVNAETRTGPSPLQMWWGYRAGLWQAERVGGVTCNDT